MGKRTLIYSRYYQIEYGNIFLFWTPSLTLCEEQYWEFKHNLRYPELLSMVFMDNGHRNIFCIPEAFGYCSKKELSRYQSNKMLGELV